MLKFLLLFFTLSIFSQNHTITGVVFDDKEKPLESANIIANPLTEKAKLKFTQSINNVKTKSTTNNKMKQHS
jgi:hypothetical protein